MTPNPPRVAYVLKVWPRFSQTFVLREILNHEAAGQPIEIFALRRSDDSAFHESLARVQAPVTYLDRERPDAEGLWDRLHQASRSFPGLGEILGEDVPEGAVAVDAALRVATAVRERRITHLHAHFGKSATTVARLAARIAGVPYSFTAHARDIFHESVRPADLARKVRDAAAVVTVSRYNKRHLDRTFGPPDGRVRVVYNGLDLGDAPYAPAAEPRPTILGVGRLVPKKGFEILVDACALLAKRGVRFRCDIVGDGPLREALTARIAGHGLEDRVALLGPLSSHRVLEHMRSAALVAAPCVVAEDGDRDGLPTVLLEAMASGTPCVSTDVTGIPEVIVDEDTGLCVPRGDVGALADACARLLGDRGFARELARRARARIERDFDLERNVARLREMFAESRAEDPSVGRSGLRRETVPETAS